MGTLAAAIDGAVSAARHASRAIQTVQATDIPLWSLIVVVIGGTVIVVTGLVFTLIFLQRWRRRRRRRGMKRTVVIDGREVSVDGGGDGSPDSFGDGDDSWGRGGKLRKRQREVSLGSSEVDVSEGEMGMRSISPVSATRESAFALPPVLPGIFLSRLSLGRFSVASSSKSQRESDHGSSRPEHRRQTSNAWVDEDRLHGPAMNVSPRKGKDRSPLRRGSRKLRGSWRRSIRESWPLKSISPTIPKLAAFSSSSNSSPRPPRVDHLGIQHPVRAATVSYGSAAAFRFPSPTTTATTTTPHMRGLTVPKLPFPKTAAEQGPSLGYSPPRQLPKPPKQALLAASAEAAGRAHERSSSGSWAALSLSSRTPGPSSVQRERGGRNFYVYEETSQGLVSADRRQQQLRMSPSGKGRRVTSSDSELSQILKGMEKRLAEGVISGSGSGSGGSAGRRSQTNITTSPSKRMLARSAMARERVGPGPVGVVTGVVGNESSATLVGTASRTPSPLRIHKLGHARQDSQHSVMSDADSLVADTSPGLEYYHGLTSPTKMGLPTMSQQKQQQQSPLPPQLMRRHSLAGSMTSSVGSLMDRSLSDIDERNSEEAADETRITAPGSSIPADLNKIAGFAGNGNGPMDDPFVSMKNSPAGSAREGGRVYPASRGVHAFNDAPRLLGGPFNRSVITLNSLRSDSPLSVISGNSRSPDLRDRRNSTDKTSPIGVSKIQTPQSLPSKPPGVYSMSAPPTSAVSSSANLHRRQLSTVQDVGDDENKAGLNIPGLALTSPSEKSKTSPLPKRTSELRAESSSPTLGRSRERTPDIPPPSPALSRNTPRLSSVYDYYSNIPSADNASCASSTYRRAAGEVRKISDDTTSSRYSDLDKTKLEEVNRLSTIMNEQVLNNTRAESPRTIRLVPPESGHLPVSVTVAHLRRMNSQINSFYSDGSANSPVLPTLREEDTGRFVSPPRTREAAQNYLALGSSPRSPGRGAAAAAGHKDIHDDKENERVSGLELKLPKIHLDENITLRQTPGKSVNTPMKRSKKAAGERSPERRSEESLGLYDADGFWISPERRLSRRG